MINKNYKNLLLSVLCILFLITACSNFKFGCAGSPEKIGFDINRNVAGLIGYKIPDSMEVDQKYDAVVEIEGTLKDSTIGRLFERYGERVDTIKISSIMSVKLTDPENGRNFEITSLSSETQTVDSVSSTLWRWIVIPKSGGENVLVVQVTGKTKNELGEASKDLPIYKKTVIVHSSFPKKISNFVSDYWQWLVSVIIIPLIIAGYRKIKHRKKHPEPGIKDID